ncbi:MAG: type IV toxin-antitoxin system AbiEi family antitoxin domain-containing protein [Candidatus Altiarchaeota archaeon]
MKTKKVLETFKGQPCFTLQDAIRLLKPSEPAYVTLMLHNLVKQEKLFRVRRGVYSAANDPQIVGFAFPPFYYGCQDALSLHGMWEQETNPVVITTRKVRSGLRSFEGSNYLVRRINRTMFFGYESMQYGEYWIPVSIIEKTFIDMVYYRQHMSKELINEFKKQIEKPGLQELLKRCPPRLAKQVTKRLKIGKK